MAEHRQPQAALALAALGLALALVSGPMAHAGTVDRVLAGRWSADERAAIDRALERIPAGLRLDAAPLVARDAIDCGPDGWPADDDDLIDDRGRIHLCAAPIATPARDGARDVGRQVALALLFAADRAAGWSADPAWRRLNQWRSSITDGFHQRAANLDPLGFAGARGQRSPRWDLVTFMAALWLDPAPHGDDDGGIGCRLISQARFVSTRVARVPEPPPCDAFEAWANLTDLASVEVVLAAPSTAMVGSLFGHLFLRLVYRDGERDGQRDGEEEDDATPAHLSRTVAFLADNDVPFTEDPAYALKGIVGSYTASLHERSFLEAYRDYVVIEGRDLRRWRLNLDVDERRALLQRIWTVAHSARYAYYFFRRNCATLMVDLVDSVRAAEPTGPPPGVLAAPPASTLEPWAGMRATDGAPLLQFVAEPILSFDHQARLAARDRIALESRLTLTTAFRDAHAVTPDVRAAAYDRLASLLASPPAGSTGDLSAWLRDSVLIETQLSAVANLEAEARAERQRRQSVRAATAQVTAQLVRAATATPRLARALTQVAALEPTARLAGYRALLALTRDPTLSPEVAGRMRLLALLQSELRYDVPRMKSVPGLRDALLFVDPALPIVRQPYLEGHAQLLRLPSETRVSAPLRALQRAKQALFAARALGDAAALPPAATTETAQVSLTARRAYDDALPRSGLDRLAVLGGVAIGAAPARAGLVLAGALYDEQLGDHRRFGFPSDTALVVGRSAVFLTMAGRAPTVAAYEARLFGYRSLRAPLPESGTGSGALGWELFGTLEGDRARALATKAQLGWGVLAPLIDRDELSDHLLAGASLAYAAYFLSTAAATPDQPQALSVPLSLEARHGLGGAARYRSGLAARIWFEPMAVLAGDRAALAWESGARVETRLALGTGARALLVRAQALRTTLTFTGARAAMVGALTLGFDLR